MLILRRRRCAAGIEVQGARLASALKLCERTIVKRSQAAGHDEPDLTGTKSSGDRPCTPNWQIGMLFAQARIPLFDPYCTVCTSEAELLATLEFHGWVTLTVIDPVGSAEVVKVAVPLLS